MRFHNYSASGTVTLNPGTYCGGIHVGNATVTLNSGLYILKGGAISTQSANSHISGSGVTFFNTYDATYSYSGFSISANSTASFVAPTTGTYAGVLIMEDRRIAANTYTDDFGGGASAAYTGIIYGPKSTMHFHGNAALTAYTIIVAYRLSMVGTTAINNDYSSLPSGNPIKITALVE
jgi:hypothetical protein